MTIQFSDFGASLFADLADVVNADSNNFAPEGILSDFNGLSALETWQLFFEVDSFADPLGFHSATLNITSEQVNVSAP